MPLHVARLRDSDLASEESPEACWYALLLWSASWHQLPAASLPNNDVVLTRLLGLGRDVKTFTKHKAAALRGFVLCDDGRLYHPVVAEQALIAWNGKLQQRWRTELARIKKANQRHGTDLPFPTFEQFLAGDVPNPRPEDVPGDINDCPSGNSIQEKGTGTGTETERLEERPPNPPSGGADDPVFEKAWKAYPQAGRATIAKPLGRQAWDETISAGADPSALASGAEAVSTSDYAKAGGKPVRFDRWLRKGLWANDAAEPVSSAQQWPGPQDVRAAFVAECGESWVRSYIDRCAWLDVPQRALIPASGAARKKITSEAADVLSDQGITVLERAA